MTPDGTEKPAPQTMTELFDLAKENLKRKGLDRPAPSPSNYQSSAKTNRKLLDSLFLEQRLFDPVEADTSCSLFGVRMSSPVFCSALSRPPHLSDEEMIDIVRGMGQAGTMMMLGMGGSEQLQAAIDTGTPVVRIVKPYRDTDLFYKQVKEAAERGCVAVGTDIDYFHGAFRDGAQRYPETFGPKKTVDIKQAISLVGLPFIIKGVLSVRDAIKAAEVGASAVIVSNHMWSAFDFGVPAIMALPKVSDAVGSKITVLADSGFRTGNDVFKALAFGASGVGFTTSVVAAVSAGGADGVERFVGFVTHELKRTMAICGCPGLSEIDRSLLTLSPEIRPWW